MPLVRPLSHLRRKSHLHTRLELRDERVYFGQFLRILVPMFLIFAVVDTLSTGGSFFHFFLIRLFTAIFATAAYLLMRARVHYGIRLFALTMPYIYSVEYIMIKYSLTQSPYFAGFGLVMFVSTIFFPTPRSVAIPFYALSVAPICIWYALHPLPITLDTLNVISMALGTGLVCGANSIQLSRELRRRLTGQERLARDLGQRQIEVWDKANELVKRKAFESQFSPQIVSAILNGGSAAVEMRQREVVIIVIDVEGSTAKADSLDPDDYKAVIEEVFDVFSSACLRWNVTVDKFTGDGAQAFAGAPVQADNDYWRALMAAGDTLQMIGVRAFSLRHRWRSPLRVRAAVCKGSALVGFLGRGSLKSFTAIGDTVSFTHRLCAISEPGKIASYSLNDDRAPELPELDWEVQKKNVTHLKGFGTRVFEVNFIRPVWPDSILVDNGRCRICETPLILEDASNGLPKLSCPGCIARSATAA